MIRIVFDRVLIGWRLFGKRYLRSIVNIFNFNFVFLFECLVDLVGGLFSGLDGFILF